MPNPTLTVPGRVQQVGFGLQTGGSALSVPGGSTPAPVSIGKFGAVGAACTWANWVKWRQGTMASPKVEIVHEAEGDGSRAEALTYKKLQYGVGKILTAPRPFDAARLLSAVSGAGSDTVGALSGSVYPHVIKPQAGGANDYYTIQQQIGQGQVPTTTLLQDAICYSLQIQASTSSPVLIMDADWYSINTSLESNTINGVGGAVATSTPTNYVPAPIFEAAGPYFFYAGTWALPFGVLAGNSTAAVKELTWKASSELSPGDFQAESIFTLPYTMGLMQVQVDQTILWQDGGVGAWIYYGKTSSLVAGTPVNDIAVAAQTAPSGVASFTFACSSDATQTLGLTMPAVVYEAGDFTPDLSGKPVEQKITGHAMRYSSNGADNSFAYTATVNVTKDGYGGQVALGYGNTKASS